METSNRAWEVFFDVQRGLPRQGPGCAASTLEALRACGEFSSLPRIADIGCGPGMQTTTLASESGGTVIAVDLFREYLAQLAEEVRAKSLEPHVHRVVSDMQALPFRQSSFDLLWAEGSAYILGVERALREWSGLLKRGGCFAFTELVWLRAEPEKEVSQFFAEEYPAMMDVGQVASLVEDTGYELLHHFTLPDSAWWDCYYHPLERKLPGMLEKYHDDDFALEVVRRTEREIEVRRRHAEDYGYEFFVARWP